MSGFKSFLSNPFAGGSLAALTTNPVQPAFLAHNNTAESNVTGDSTTATISFDTEIFDQGSNFSSGTFTAPVTGKYLLSCGVDMDQVNSTNHTLIKASIATSNRNYDSIDEEVGSTSAHRVWRGLTVLADMDAGDTATVRLQVQGNSKVVDILGASTLRTFFSGHLVA